MASEAGKRGDGVAQKEPDAHERAPVDAEKTEEHGQQPQQDTPKKSRVDEDSSKKCWICFADSTEDTADSSPWRSPCPCALVAHEDCLLDWIADIEAPDRNRSRSLASRKIQCPQCKADIKLSRPRDIVVEAVRSLERLAAQAALPGTLALLSMMLYSGSMHFGDHAIITVFGVEDGWRIMRSARSLVGRPSMSFNEGILRGVLVPAIEVLRNALINWRHVVGVPMIAPLLILSRTSLVDPFLPVLPVIFFGSRIGVPYNARPGIWPPSASLAFAVLPYIRQGYNVAYRRVFEEKYQRWIKEIQPRFGQNQNDQDDEDDGDDDEDDAEDGDDEENVFEVRIDGDLWEGWDGEERPADVPGLDRPAEANGALHDAAIPPPDIADNRPNAPVNAANHPLVDPNPPPDEHVHAPNAAERRLAFSALGLAEAVLGSLCFPLITGLTGNLLEYMLPATWTTKPMGAFRMRLPARGLLQEKWGRSLVGGCLFVVLKDAVVLYSRWRMVQMHRARRVVDYDGKKR